MNGVMEFINTADFTTMYGADTDVVDTEIYDMEEEIVELLVNEVETIVDVTSFLLAIMK